MRKIISGIVLSLIFASYAIAATTYTTHYNLAKPSDGSTSWGSSIRDNFDTIDTQLYSSSNSISNHISDTVGAHAATAISTSVGTYTCLASDTVQEYLDCLDSQIGGIMGGGVVLVVTDQTIAGNKTFTGITSFDSAVNFTNLSDGIAHIASDLITSSLVINQDVDSAAGIDFSKLATLADGNILVGSSGGVATSVNPSGDIDISNTGVFSISSNVIVNNDVNASAAIDFSKLAALTSGNILVGNASNVPTSTAVTGDISITNGGVTAYVGTLPLNKGGTGQTTKAPAFDALSPMTTGGDLIYGGASGTGTRLANGSAGQILSSAGGTSAPAWSDLNTVPTSVTTNSTGQERIERVRINLSGASACSINSQSGSWVSSVSASGSVCTVNFTGSTFSSAPTCVCTPQGFSADVKCRVTTVPTTSSFAFDVTNNSGTRSLDPDVQIICMGAK